MKKTFTYLRKCTLIALALFGASELSAQRNQISISQITADSDDAEEMGTNGSSPGTMDLTSSDIELVVDGNDGNQFVGLRFSSLNLPKNAVIDSAFLQFTVDEINTGATSVIIKVEDNDSSVTFSNTAFDISSRVSSSDSVLWSNIPAWSTAQVKTLDQRSTDVSSLVNRIMQRNGWNPGNPITFLITGTGERTAEAHRGNGNESVELIVHYSTPISSNFAVTNGNDDAEEDLTNGAMDLTSSDIELTTDGQDQAIGIRFSNVTIPQGSIITKAYLQFQVDEVSTTGNVDVAILMQDDVNPTGFLATANNIIGRTYSGADTILWSVPTWATIGDKGTDQQSPSLITLVQNMVNKPNWFAGNAISFGLIDPAYLGFAGYTGNTGKRTAESYDGAAAPELIVEYIEPQRYTPGAFPIVKGSSWKFDDSGSDLGTTWTTANFKDSSWAFGDAPLGYSNPVATTVSFGNDANDKHITTYLRHTFNGANTAQYDSLIFDVLRDDGAIVYINGVEAFRTNMPNGTVGFDTTAIAVVGGADETTYYRFTVDNTLNSGTNVISVELHQQAGTSSDLSFDMEVTGKLPPLATTAYPIASGDEWSYLDDSTDLTTTAWKTLNYNDTAWAYGASPLGYSNPVTTELSFGPDPNNKYVTYYFRKRINIANLGALADSLIFNVKRDDGAIIYVNGAEVLRTNMPAGPVNNRTKSSTIVSGADENRFYATTLPKSVFVQGDNIVAVELHQRDSISSDLTFDMEILELPKSRKACAGVNDPHISCYTSLFPTAQGPDFFIPETHAFQVLLKQGDQYTNQNVRTSAPGNNDFTGYIGRSGSSIDGFVGINHENSPGGFSIIDIRYVDTTRTWVVDSSQAVDFYNNDLVSTVRNCSGGITPWGTWITSEESTNAGDANSDGYQDIGWQVEIDPITRKVPEYSTPGKQEKLWALGRMSHENIAVANDSITAYEGEDRGSGCVYKFIADNPMDLSSGRLYALKLDSNLVGGEPVVSTGTWIRIPNTTQADRNTTNSLAISLGATPFNGVEDVEVGTVDGKIYFTSKGYGRVYSFSDDTDTTVSQFKTFVGGQSYLINYGSGIVSEPWSSGNDNLCFDDLGNLYVLQDGDRDHIWMVGPSHTQTSPKVDIFAKLPSGSESCGMTFTPDYKFMFLSVQHPSGGNSSTFQIDANGDTTLMNISQTLVIARKEFLGNYAPTLAATNLSFTATCDSVDLTFNTGNGNGHLVVAKELSKVDESPEDGVTYNDTLVFGLGDDLGNGNFVLYNGTDSTLTVKGLQKNVEYHVSIFEYNEAPNKYYNVELVPSDSVQVDSVATSAIAGNFNTLQGTSQPYTVSGAAGSTFNWIASAGTITAGQGTDSIQLTLPASMGSLELKVVETNVYGCEGDTVSQTINFGTTGIESFDISNSVSVAPNPTTGRTTLKVVGTTEAINLTIYDMVGKVVKVMNNITSPYELDLTEEGKGTYILRLESNQKVATKRLMVR